MVVSCKISFNKAEYGKDFMSLGFHLLLIPKAKISFDSQNNTDLFISNLD